MDQFRAKIDIRGESLEETANKPKPDILVADIVEDLRDSTLWFPHVPPSPCLLLSLCYCLPSPYPFPIASR